MKEFMTAAQEAAGVEDQFLEFSVDGVLCKAERPTDGQIAVLMATTNAKHLTEGEMVAGIINFFASTLDDQTHNYITNKLLDRKDPFGLLEVQDIIQWMMEEWSARPTKSSPASTQSQRSDGPNSTPPTPTQTSLPSPYIAS